MDLVVGRVVKAHGITGEVVVEVRTDDPDEFYDHQLEGLRVVTIDGRLIGNVNEVLHTAAGELLSVTTETGAEVLVPFVSAIVSEVSLQDQTIEIDPPEGLLELQ